MDEFENTKNEEERLKNHKDDCEKKHKKAGSLIEKLSGENISWQEAVVKQKAARECLTGDILICSGIIAYLGVFTTQYRTICVDNWIEMLKGLNIQSSQEISLNAALGNPVNIRQWLIDRLP